MAFYDAIYCDYLLLFQVIEQLAKLSWILFALYFAGDKTRSQMPVLDYVAVISKTEIKRRTPLYFHEIRIRRSVFRTLNQCIEGM